MICLLEFLLIRNIQMSVKENQLNNSFNFLSLFFNQNTSSNHVKENIEKSDSNRFFLITNR
jgi:hypothetical protein